MNALYFKNFGGILQTIHENRRQYQPDVFASVKK
jgi:hypothetical protein